MVKTTGFPDTDMDTATDTDMGKQFDFKSLCFWPEPSMDTDLDTHTDNFQ
jgi:hypothetical protein